MCISVDCIGRIRGDRQRRVRVHVLKSERMKELRKRQAERREDEEERVKQYADAYDVEEIEIETDNIEDFDAMPDDFNGEDKGDY